MTPNTETSEMVRLKPCPFCNKQPVTHDYRSWSDQTGEVEGYAAVECHCLGPNGGLFFHFDTLDNAIAAWNRRAPTLEAAEQRASSDVKVKGGAESEGTRSQTHTQQGIEGGARPKGTRSETLEEAAAVADDFAENSDATLPAKLMFREIAHRIRALQNGGGDGVR